MPKLRIGMIGYGVIGRVHALGYKAIPHLYGLPADAVRVVAVATSRPETAEEAAREIGCEAWTADYLDLLAREDIDAVDCCTPNGSHEAIMIAAAKAGKHLYCEKPLANTVAEARHILEAAQAAGVLHQVSFNFRGLPAVMRAKQLLLEGFVGRVFSFRARYYRSSYIDPHKPLSWKLRMADSGGGAIIDIGSHALDLLYYLLGEFGSVQAALDTVIRERPVAPGSHETGAVDVDDLALLHLRLADGTLGLAEISRLGTGATNELVIEIYGEKGALRFDLTNPAWLEVYDARDPAVPMGGLRGTRRVETVGRYEGAKAPDWSMPPDFLRSHAESQYQFYRAVTEGRSPSPNFADGLHVQAVIAAAQRASAEGRWVRLDEVVS